MTLRTILLSFNLLVVSTMAAEEGRSLGKVLDWLNEEPEESESEDEDSLDETILSYATIWGPSVAFVLGIIGCLAFRKVRQWRLETPMLDPSHWSFDLVEKESDVEENNPASQTVPTIIVCKKHKEELCTFGCHADYTLLNQLHSQLGSKTKRPKAHKVDRVVTQWFQELPTENDNSCTGTNLERPPHDSAALLLQVEDPARIITGFGCNCYHYRSKSESRPSSKVHTKRFVRLAQRATKGYEKVAEAWKKNQEDPVEQLQPAASATDSLSVVPGVTDEQKADESLISLTQEEDHA